MNDKEFYKQSLACGYGYVGNTKEYIRTHPKKEYTQEDFVELFRYANHVEGEGLNRMLDRNGRSHKTSKRFINVSGK